jgi:hypothetical protein
MLELPDEPSDPLEPLEPLEPLDPKPRKLEPVLALPHGAACATPAPVVSATAVPLKAMTPARASRTLVVRRLDTRVLQLLL